MENIKIQGEEDYKFFDSDAGPDGKEEHGADPEELAEEDQLVPENGATEEHGTASEPEDEIFDCSDEEDNTEDSGTVRDWGSPPSFLVFC